MVKQISMIALTCVNILLLLLSMEMLWAGSGPSLLLFRVAIVVAALSSVLGFVPIRATALIESLVTLAVGVVLIPTVLLFATGGSLMLMLSSDQQVKDEFNDSMAGLLIYGGLCLVACVLAGWVARERGKNIAEAAPSL
jgi:SNF family Na+-dependent transporter